MLNPSSPPDASTSHRSSRAETVNSPSQNTPAPPRRRSSRRGLWITVIVLGLAGFTAYRVMHRQPATPAPGSRGGPGSGMPVPVVAGAVQKKDMPIYLDGIGTVQAFNTVTVNPRVDGEVKQIAFAEGQNVKAGDLLAQIDPAPFQAAYDQAVAKQGTDEAQLVNARLNLVREQDLFAKKAVSVQERDTQQALVNQLDAAVKADAAAIQSAKVQLDYTRIVAPIAGRTGIRLVDQGNVVRAADRTGIVVLTQLQPISLLFTLPEQDLVEIQKVGADPSELTVLAVDRDSSTVLDTGKVSVIDNQIDTTTGTIRLKATFANEQFKLWPGQFANARLLVTVRKDGLVVPASVVQRGPQGSFAFVIKADETVEIRPVKVGPIEKGQALIEDGLAEGERVVVDGQYKLQPGSHVKIAEPAAAPAGAAGSGNGSAAAGPGRHGGRPGGPGGAPK